MRISQPRNRWENSIPGSGNSKIAQGVEGKKGQFNLELKEQEWEWNETRLERHRSIRTAMGNNWKIFNKGCTMVRVDFQYRSLWLFMEDRVIFKKGGPSHSGGTNWERKLVECRQEILIMICM